jgi:cyclopropane-fatty-acyl-phospholipid synthase
VTSPSTSPPEISADARRAIGPPPSGRLATARARIAHQVFRRGLSRVPVVTELPDGTRWGRQAGDAPVIVVRRPRDLFLRLGADANIGFGEAYMAGDWYSDRVADVLAVLAAYLVEAVPPSLQALRGRAQQIRPGREDNTIDTARDNVARHYDLSNDLFALFLDPTMTYSAAQFSPSELAAPSGGDLTAAQVRKIDAILDGAGVASGSRLLEIGTGWGELAVRAALRGARVTTLTLSREQARLAERRCADAGVADRVRILIQDYRQARGQYDALVSVEMIEAVGERYWPAYFASIERLLAPSGRACLQSITMPHERMLISRRRYTWMNKHIFPGGLIPSIRAIEDAVRSCTSLRITARADLGPHYARTLRLWQERFMARRADVGRLGFDRAFQRAWEYYLAYCEAGFRTGYIDVNRFVLAR